MADNYLENKFDELSGRGKGRVVYKKIGQPLESLLRRNRSYRGYRKDYTVTREMLEKIVQVNPLLPSARNQQALRFRLVTQGDEAERVLANIRLGGALPELHLPFAGSEPSSFIVICSCVEENRMVDIDLGIAAQSMLLKAVEMGLNGIIICAFNKENLRCELSLPYDPLAIIAVGKGNEQIECVPVSAGDSHAYYRRNGVHYVPKVRWEELIITAP